MIFLFLAFIRKLSENPNKNRRSQVSSVIIIISRYLNNAYGKKDTLGWVLACSQVEFLGSFCTQGQTNSGACVEYNSRGAYKKTQQLVIWIMNFNFKFCFNYCVLAVRLVMYEQGHLNAAFWAPEYHLNAS